MTAAQQQRCARETFKSSRSSPAHVNVPWGDTATQSTPSPRVVHGSGRCRFFGQQDTYGKGCALRDVARLAAGTSIQPPRLRLPRTTGSTEAARTLPDSCLRHGFACYTSLFSFVQLRHDHLDPDFSLLTRCCTPVFASNGKHSCTASSQWSGCQYLSAIERRCPRNSPFAAMLPCHPIVSLVILRRRFVQAVEFSNPHRTTRGVLRGRCERMLLRVVRCRKGEGKVFEKMFAPDLHPPQRLTS
ncbi:hypothetical protein BKA80DRAFT_48456 [Phyllosticta citrichinensis]